MIEMKVGDRMAKVEILSQDGHQIQVMVDDKKYEIDLVEVEHGIYSILHNNKSYNIELVENSNDAKSFVVNTYEESFDIQVVDAEARYLMNRGSGLEDEGTRTISSPMPGKVVKIPVQVGDEVAEGTTVVIVEAMKMQSEYKVKTNRIIKEILVKEGDAVDGNQPLIVVE